MGHYNFLNKVEDWRWSSSNVRMLYKTFTQSLNSLGTYINHSDAVRFSYLCDPLSIAEGSKPRFVPVSFG